MHGRHVAHPSAGERLRLAWPSPSTSANAEPEPTRSTERWRGSVADRPTIDVATRAGPVGFPDLLRRSTTWIEGSLFQRENLGARIKEPG